MKYYKISRTTHNQQLVQNFRVTDAGQTQCYYYNYHRWEPVTWDISQLEIKGYIKLRDNGYNNLIKLKYKCTEVSETEVMLDIL